MLCRNPYSKDGAMYGCGQCMPCRVNRRRLWTHRIMLETALQAENSFLTLTYSDDHLPKTSKGLPTLDPTHLQLWLKRLRKEISPLLLRFYAVGEYSASGRPHYHVIIFGGLPPCKNIQTRTNERNQPIPLACCPSCALIQNTWCFYSENGSKHSLGLIYNGEVTQQSAAYTAGYVEKKLTAKDDHRLNGRHPEFMRCSKGIGKGFLWDVASVLLEHDLENLDDVPSQLRHGNRVMPLGRYLRSKLREMVGKDPKAPQATLDAIKEEMRPLRETAFENSRSFKDEVIKAGNQRVLNMETKAAIFKSKRERLK